MTQYVFLKLPEVKRRTGKKKTQIYRDIKAGTFPKQLSIGQGGVAWLESEIIKWQEEKIKNRAQTFREMVGKPSNDNKVLNDNHEPQKPGYSERQL